MGLSDLVSASTPHGRPLVQELWAASMYKGAEIATPGCLLLSPLGWLYLRQTSPGIKFYDTVLPRAGCAGLFGGLAAGTLAVAGVALSTDREYMQGLVTLAYEEDNDTLDRWALAGAGFAALVASPGPGSVLFHNTPWMPRLAGGSALGLAMGVAVFAASRMVKPLARVQSPKGPGFDQEGEYHFAKHDGKRPR